MGTRKSTVTKLRSTKSKKVTISSEKYSTKTSPSIKPSPSSQTTTPITYSFTTESNSTALSLLEQIQNEINQKEKEYQALLEQYNSLSIVSKKIDEVISDSMSMKAKQSKRIFTHRCSDFNYIISAFLGSMANETLEWKDLTDEIASASVYQCSNTEIEALLKLKELADAMMKELQEQLT